MTDPTPEAPMKLEQARKILAARTYGVCEGCGRYGLNRDPHHRKARGSGGVHRMAAEIANDVRNLLALCRACHDRTEDANTWTECQMLGWRLEQWQDPLATPALIYTVNGYGWWHLTNDGGYEWSSMDPTMRLDLAA